MMGCPSPVTMKGQHCCSTVPSHTAWPLPCSKRQGGKTRCPGLECSQSGSTLLLVYVVLQAAEPTVLLVDLPHGQDAVQHALQHAPVHGDH